MTKIRQDSSLEFNPADVVTLEHRPTQFRPEDAEEPKRAVDIFEIGIPSVLLSQICASEYSAGTSSDHWAASGDPTKVGRTVNRKPEGGHYPTKGLHV